MTDHAIGLLFPSRTGLTAENIGEALLNQFGNGEFKRHTYPFINTPEKRAAVANKLNQSAEKFCVHDSFVSVVNDEIP